MALPSIATSQGYVAPEPLKVYPALRENILVMGIYSAGVVLLVLADLSLTFLIWFVPEVLIALVASSLTTSLVTTLLVETLIIGSFTAVPLLGAGIIIGILLFIKLTCLE